jgi:hypothetical protein
MDSLALLDHTHILTHPPSPFPRSPLSPSSRRSAQVQVFVDGLFDMSRDLKAYKHHLRDFLIQVLVSRRRSTAGAAAPNRGGQGGDRGVQRRAHTRPHTSPPLPHPSSPLPSPLTHTQEFKGDEGGVEALFAEEQAAKAAEDMERRKAVPGLLNPYQKDMDDEL